MEVMTSRQNLPGFAQIVKVIRRSAQNPAMSNGDVSTVTQFNHETHSSAMTA
jgi:hypothetical protein